ncbi:hypothetical protein SAMN05444157_2111 [Frankineae bacterium MT45]|nr:hypothetical protein SAMN05444157_2111 [Frankineae bacterium MT45]
MSLCDSATLLNEMTQIPPPTPPQPPAEATEPGPSDPATPANPAPKRVTRRWILGSAVVLAGGAVGVVAGLKQPFGRSNPFDHHVPLPDPPPQLLSAADREAQLIASLEAARQSSPADSRLAQLLSDHRAHSAALTATLAQYAPQPAVTTSSPPTAGVNTATLRAQETAAQTAAASESEALEGDLAVLLASISACEATHVELLQATNG